MPFLISPDRLLTALDIAAGQAKGTGHVSLTIVSPYAVSQAPVDVILRPTKSIKERPRKEVKKNATGSITRL